MKKVKIEIEISENGESNVKTNGINSVEDVKYLKASVKILNSMTSGMASKFKKEQDLIKIAEKAEEKRLKSLKSNLSKILAGEEPDEGEKEEKPDF